MTTLQLVFYTIGIVYMVLAITVLVALLIALLYFKKRFDNLQDNLKEKVNTARDMLAVPSLITKKTGAAGMTLLYFLFRRFFR